MVRGIDTEMGALNVIFWSILALDEGDIQILKTYVSDLKLH